MYTTDPNRKGYTSISNRKWYYISTLGGGRKDSSCPVTPQPMGSYHNSADEKSLQLELYLQQRLFVYNSSSQIHTKAFLSLFLWTCISFVYRYYVPNSVFCCSWTNPFFWRNLAVYLYMVRNVIWNFKSFLKVWN